MSETLKVTGPSRGWRPPKGVSKEPSGIYRIPADMIMVLEGQPREYFDPVRMKELRESIAEVGQRDPAMVRPLKNGAGVPFGLVNGERRFRTCQDLGIPLRAVVEVYESEDDVFMASFISNFNHAEHDAIETAKALMRIYHMERMQQYKHGERLEVLGRMFGRDVQSVRAYMSLLKLPADVQRLMRGDVPKNKRFPITVGARIAGLDKKLQEEVLTEMSHREIKAKHAQRLIDRVITRNGADKKRKGRKPSDDWDLLKAYVERTGEDMGPFTDLSAEGKLEELFEKRGVLELKVLNDDIEAIMVRLKSIQEQLYAQHGKMAG